MKKFFAVLLALALVFSLSACGKDKDKAPESKPTPPSSSSSPSSSETEPDETEDLGPQVGDTLYAPEASVNINYCPAFYVDYLQTTYGESYAFAIATEYKKGVRTLYMRDKTVGDEWVFVADGEKTLEAYSRETLEGSFIPVYSGEYAAEECADIRNSYEHILLELERFMNPAEKGYSFVKMNDGYTDFGAAYVYNQFTNGTADGLVYIDKSTGIMVKSKSHKEGDHDMEVLDYTFQKGQLPEFK